MGHRVMKVFDCTDMPEDLRRKFYELYDNKGNDSSVEWTVGDSGDDGTCRLVDKWLIENGASSEGYESVIITYWW